MPEYLITLEKLSSILSVFFAFVLWILSRNFASKDELKKELNIINTNNTKEIKSIYQDLNHQRINIAQLNTKMDNLIKSVDQLNLMVNEIKDHLINYRLSQKINSKLK